MENNYYQKVIKILTIVCIIALCGCFFCRFSDTRKNQKPTLVKTLDIIHLENWKLLVSDDVIPEEKYAIREFQYWYKTITGIDLPIVKKQTREGNYIFIGNNQDIANSAYGIDTISFDSEDLFISIQEKRIIITGGRPRGVLYGVYSFLERYLDIRFLTPEYTHVPELEKRLITLPENYLYRPQLQYRLSSFGETFSNPVFAVRLRNNKQIHGDKFEKLGVNMNTEYGRVGHSFHRQISCSKYGKDHPEYFAIHDGSRRNKAEYFEGFEVQPCLSNPEVLEIVTENVLDELDKNSNKTFVSVAQNDNSYYCECPQCAAIDKIEGAHSGSLIKFVNAVATRVAEKNTDVIIGTFAYSYSLNPPKNIHPAKNVLVQLCSIECSQIFPINDPRSPRNRKFVKNAEDWAKVCNKINIWTYNTNFHNYLLPCPNLWNIGSNVNFFVKKNARGIYMQGQANNTGGAFSDLYNYVTSKILWNPELSGEELINEFLTLYYGNAAPPIKEWLELLHESAIEQGIIKDINCYAKPSDFGITPHVAQEGVKAFRRALKLAENVEIRNRVEKVSISAYRAAIGDLPFLLSSKKYKMWKKGLWKPEKYLSSEAAEQAMPYMRKLVELCRKYKVQRWSEGWKIEDALEIWHEVFRMEENESF